MRNVVFIIAAATGIWLQSSGQQAQAACEEALVRAQSTIKTSHDKRLAVLVTEKQWNEAKQKGGINVVIYDIPIGASYDAYNAAAREYLSQINSSEQDSYEAAWSGLDPNSVPAYEACLKAFATQAGGPHLAVVTADDDRYTLLVTWNEPGKIRTRASWTPNGLFKNLPDPVLQGAHKITVLRPTNNVQLSWNSPFGASETVLLSPKRGIPNLPAPCISPIPAQGVQFVSEQTLDFNNDGCPDVATIHGSHLNTVADVNFGFRKGSAPPATVRSGVGDEGYAAFRWWVDLDGDGARFFCRVGGDGPYVVECSKVNASGSVEPVRNLGVTDKGYAGTGYWRVAPGNVRFCRGVGNNPSAPQIACARTDGQKWLSQYDPP